jgi:N-acetylglucosamine-6-sulfatase
MPEPAATADRKRIRVLALAAAACALLVAGVAIAKPFPADAQAGKPNVIFILTDDQAMDEMAALPQTQSLIGGQGASFSRAYISYPLCCPSRAALLSGQYMHNNGVRGNSAPDGGWDRFDKNGTEAKALPTWLKDAGYYNVLIGKYMNGYGGAPAPVPPGWDEWYGKISEYDEGVVGAGIYFNYHLQEDPPVGGGVACPNPPLPPPAPGQPFLCRYGQDEDDYQTDVLTEKTVEAIDRVAPGAAPFFMAVNFNAPHSPYVPAPRHDGNFGSVAMNKPAGQNEKDIRDKPRFLRRLPLLNKNALSKIANRRRARLEMLQSVDQGVTRIVDELEDAGELDNTYLIFMSDNGYFSGEHRIRQGKYLPHEPSSHVPLLIRGPGIPAGGNSNALVSNVDVAATIAAVTGATPKLAQDGRSLLPFAQNPALPSSRPILLEGDNGQSIDDDGAETPGVVNDAGDAKRIKAFRKKVKAQKRKLKKRCKKLKRESPRRAFLCFKKGVANIDQEPTDKVYKLRAPAYAGLRTERYALFLYATGEVEMYDMAKDPFQLKGVQWNKRYANVRKWLLAKLPEYANCKGNACSAALGPEPKPLKKPKPKTKKKKKAKPKK